MEPDDPSQPQPAAGPSPMVPVSLPPGMPMRRQRRWDALGCLIGMAVVVALAVPVWGAVIRAIQVGGEDSSGARPIEIDSRWASRDVVLSPASPSVSLRVIFTYSGSVGGDTGPAAVIGVPEEVAATGLHSNADPAFALMDPVVRADLLSRPAGIRACGAPCELPVVLPTCASTCTETFDIRLTLIDPAGREAITLNLRAGLTAMDGSRLPSDFDVLIELGESSGVVLGGTG